MNLIRHCLDECWDALAQVSDPEIPVLSVLDLGMIRGVELNAQDEIVVRLTPTYSGCPATDLLKAEIKQNLERKEVVKPTGTNDSKDKVKTTRKVEKIGRNEPCPCGSGKKYKKCCL